MSPRSCRWRAPASSDSSLAAADAVVMRGGEGARLAFTREGINPQQSAFLRHSDESAGERERFHLSDPVLTLQRESAASAPRASSSAARTVPSASAARRVRAGAARELGLSVDGISHYTRLHEARVKNSGQLKTAQQRAYKQGPERVRMCARERMHIMLRPVWRSVFYYFFRLFKAARLTLTFYPQN